MKCLHNVPFFADIACSLVRLIFEVKTHYLIFSCWIWQEHHGFFVPILETSLSKNPCHGWWCRQERWFALSHIDVCPCFDVILCVHDFFTFNKLIICNSMSWLTLHIMLLCKSDVIDILLTTKYYLYKNSSSTAEANSSKISVSNDKHVCDRA
jgi:hypothetical protein